MHRSKSVAVVLVATLVALTLPLSLALATSAFGQEPEPPTGGPQDPPPDAPTPTPPDEPAPDEPTGEAPTSGGGGTLPRTGWETLLYLVLGVGLVLAGARLRVITRIREVVERVRRRNTEAALREALEPIRAARLSPASSEPDTGPLHVEPSTPTAKRLTGVADRD